MQVSAHPLRRALVDNTANTTFPTTIPTATEPSGAGVFDLLSAELGLGSAIFVPAHVQIVPFAEATDDQTFDMRLWGWSKVAATALYVPQLIVELAVTLGTNDGTAIDTDVLMADTIAVTDGPADNAEWRSLIGDPANLVASIIVHTRGCRYLSFEFDVGTATKANCHFRPL
jgi:hypothetical protein